MNGQKLIKTIKKINGKDIRTFLLFLLISILVWQIEKLRQTYPEDTELNIICEDIPEGYITNKGLEKSVKVRLEGDGFSLLRMYVTNHRNIRVSLKHLRRLSSGGQCGPSLFRDVSQESKMTSQNMCVSQMFSQTQS